MMKKTALILILCLCAALCGCAREAQVPQTCAGIADSVQAAAPFAALTDATEAYLEKYLLIDASALDAWVMRRDATRATPEMILVIQVKDGRLPEIRQAVQEYHDEQIFQYRDYQPDQMFKLENAKVLEKGSFIALIVSPDAAKTNAALGAGWK